MGEPAGGWDAGPTCGRLRARGLEVEALPTRCCSTDVSIGRPRRRLIFTLLAPGSSRRRRRLAGISPSVDTAALRPPLQCADLSVLKGVANTTEIQKLIAGEIGHHAPVVLVRTSPGCRRAVPLALEPPPAALACLPVASPVHTAACSKPCLDLLQVTLALNSSAARLHELQASSCCPTACPPTAPSSCPTTTPWRPCWPRCPSR